MGSHESSPDQRRSGRVVVHDTTAWQVVEGRVVMLELDREHYYRLDAVGSRMWELLCEHGDIEATHRRILEEYDVDADRLWDDLDGLLSQCVDAGLISIKTPGS
jgi:hypothetical protein